MNTDFETLRMDETYDFQHNFGNPFFNSGNVGNAGLDLPLLNNVVIPFNGGSNTPIKFDFNFDDIKKPFLDDSHIGYNLPPDNDVVNVRGNVVDDAGNPIPLASVHVVGNTSKGTTTDYNGKFSLAANFKDIIEVRYLGYKTVNFSASKVPAKIVLKENVGLLDEITLTTSLNPSIKETQVDKPKKKDYTIPLAIGTAVVVLGALAYSKSKDKKTSKAMAGVVNVTI